MVTNEQILEEARIALNNALSDYNVSTTLAAYGYDLARLQEGLTLCENSRAALQLQGSALISKVNASKEFYELWKQAQLHANHDMRIMRLVHKQTNGIRYFVKLDPIPKQGYESWLAQARDFYHRLSTNLELQSLVAPSGITSARIEQGTALLHRLDALRLQQKAERGNESAIRHQRDEMFAALNTWMSTFRQFARIAFAASPEQLAILGMKSAVRKQNKKGEQMILPPVDVSLAFATMNQLPS